MHFKGYNLKFGVSCGLRQIFACHGDDFTKDIPKEIFYIIYKHTIQRNSCKDKETLACIGISIEDIRKAWFVFDYMNAEV